MRIWGRKKTVVNARVFEITYDDPIILPRNRWLVYANFNLIGEHEKKVHNDQLYLPVCSSHYLKKPDPDEIINDASELLVLDHLDRQKVEDHIILKINEANAKHFKDWPEYYAFLEHFFLIED